MMERGNFGGLILIVLCVSFGFCQRGLAEEKYTVKPGDTLFEISKSFGVSIEILKKANHLEKETIKPKQLLVIPTQRGKQTKETVEKSPYLVKPGDNLYVIAKKAGLSVKEIKDLNQLPSLTLKPGQRLILQKREAVDTQEEDGEEAGEEEAVGESTVAETEGGAAPEPLSKWSSSEERNLFVKVVRTFLGVPYRLGGSTLRGIDCSAFVKKIYEVFNTTLPRTAREQFRIGKSIGKEELQEGDLVFFNARRSSISHVGIYVGNGEFVHASSRNREVKVDRLDMPYFNKHFLRGVRIKEFEKES